MLLTLLLCTVLPSRVALPVAPPRDPPVDVWLDFHVFRRAGPARVFLRSRDDGYVVVLRADATGKVSVLFPLDPRDRNFVRGGQTLEIRSRGDLAAFFVDERGGAGTVLAVWSADTLAFGEFAHGDRWDYRALARRSVNDDPEAGLLAIVRSMVGSRPFDYDVAHYRVWYPAYLSPAGLYDWIRPAPSGPSQSVAVARGLVRSSFGSRARSCIAIFWREIAASFHCRTQDFLLRG